MVLLTSRVSLLNCLNICCRVEGSGLWVLLHEQEKLNTYIQVELLIVRAALQG